MGGAEGVCHIWSEPRLTSGCDVKDSNISHEDKEADMKRFYKAPICSAPPNPPTLFVSASRAILIIVSGVFSSQTEQQSPLCQ